ncbi:MAG: retron St85 family RNA-directed DNA polymerase [Armatimonadaceae bacterium]
MTKEQRERLKQLGRQGFIREEMLRLGFWPPDPETAKKVESATVELKGLYSELVRLRKELTDIEQEIAGLGDIPKLIAEVRRARIERVRTERARRKEERQAQIQAKREADREWRRKTLPYLGRGVSAGLRYEGGDSDKVAALGLPALETASDIAQAIGITEPELAWLSFHRTAASIDHYNRFTIPKKKGGVRVISSPKRRLRVAQGWLLTAILDKLTVHDAAMAFRPGRSVVDNAARHQGKAVIVKVDLKDFFPSILLKRVKGLFQSFGYNEGVATILALIATETPRAPVVLDGQKRFVAVGEQCLPQGACTSPAITNLLCRKLDSRMTGLAETMGFTYTRYADDLVFSHDSPDAPVGQVLFLGRQIITGEGYVVNEEKTQVLRPGQRQNVTGLVVNGAETGPRVSRRDLRNFRAFLHQCGTKGTATMSEQIGKDAVSYARGYLAFVHMSRPEVAARILSENPWLGAK